MQGILSGSKNCRKLIVAAYKPVNLIHHAAPVCNAYEVLGKKCHIFTLHDYVYYFCGYIGSTCCSTFKFKDIVIRACCLLRIA